MDAPPDEQQAVAFSLARRARWREDMSAPRRGFSVDASARSLTVAGQRFEFGPVAFAVLGYLIANEGRWITQREIVERAIGSCYRNDSSVARVQIHQIRKTLGAYRSCLLGDGKRGCGYMFKLSSVIDESKFQLEA
jgi:DNA-binding response OmpR family regulator